jgi:adenosylhomocysteinase
MATEPKARVPCDVKDLALAAAGKRRVDWAFQSMPVLQTVRKQLIKSQPLAGVRISACLHVTAETANLMMTLRDGGASVILCASNPLSTQDDAAASLVQDYAIPVYAIRGEDPETSRRHLAAALDHQPHITLDGGADLLTALHTRRPELAPALLGATEETTTGVMRLRAMAKEGLLPCPVIAVNDAFTKHLFDNRYGAGQSTIDGIVRATNVLLAGLNVVVAGFGWCGRGIAMRARGLGASVVITEVDPIKALDALMDGFRVMSMAEAAQIGDVFVTAAGNRHVIAKDHFERLKNGAILCNASHCNAEIDLDALARLASSRRQSREFVEEFALRDGRRIYVLSEGRLVNLTAAEGHPASIMDLSFANQVLAVEHIVKNHAALEKLVYPMPEALDQQVARLKLESMGVKIDRLTLAQEQYLASWTESA